MKSNVRRRFKEPQKTDWKGEINKEKRTTGSEKEEEVSRVLSGFSLTLRPEKFKAFFPNLCLILASVFNSNHVFVKQWLWHSLRNFIALIGSSALLRNMKIFHLITPCIFFFNKIWIKLSNTLLVILQLQIRYRHKLLIAWGSRGKLQGENKRLITYTSIKLLVIGNCILLNTS